MSASYICCGVPLLKLPQPATNKVSPVSAHIASPSPPLTTKQTWPGVWHGVNSTRTLRPPTLKTSSCPTSCVTPGTLSPLPP